MQSRLSASLVRAGALAALVGVAGCSGIASPLATQAPPPPGTPYGVTCYAGAYTCNMPAAGPLGGPCSCPGLGAPSFGTIR